MTQSARGMADTPFVSVRLVGVQRCRRAARQLRRPVLAVILAVILLTGLAAPVRAATGPDVSRWNHPGDVPIDWGQVRAAGHRFAFVKATESTSYTNAWFSTDFAGAARAGLYRGAYHFARPALPLSSATLQARYYVSVVGALNGPLDLPPVLDLEQNGGLTPADLQSWTSNWLTEVQRLTGRQPMIYTGRNFWLASMGNTAALSEYRLWFARWTASASPLPLPGSWSTWTFWQYTNAASVPGITGLVDLSRFCCSDQNLGSLGGGGNDLSARNPFGSLDATTRRPDGIEMFGWSIDPDQAGPVTVHVYVDGQWGGAATAGGTRYDVAAAYPGWGAAHGYDITVPAPPGDHRVCVYGINSGPGTTNPLLGCRSVSGAPLGALSSAQAAAGGIRLTGWSADPDTTTPDTVHLYVDGSWAGAISASGPAVSGIELGPGVTPRSYTAVVGGMADGSHSVCAYAIDTQGLSGNPLLGCRQVVVTGSPFGNLDLVTRSAAGLRVQGWAIDPDVSGPAIVHLYVDGQFLATTSAAVDRPDVGAAYPSAGPAHGYDVVLPAGPGPHRVCAYAINQGLGGINPLLACRSI